MLRQTLDNLALLKRNYRSHFKDIDNRISLAETELKDRFLQEFSDDQTKALKKMKEEVDQQRAQAMGYKETMMKKQADLARLKQAERLTVVTTLLEDHLNFQKGMDSEMALLKKLGQEDELLSELATTLERNLDTKHGLPTAQALHAECSRVINQAKFAALVDKKAVLFVLPLVEFR